MCLCRKVEGGGRVPGKDWVSAHRTNVQSLCSLLLSLVNTLTTADLLGSKASEVETLEAAPCCAFRSRAGKTAAVCVCVWWGACMCTCVSRPLLHTNTPPQCTHDEGAPDAWSAFFSMNHPLRAKEKTLLNEAIKGSQSVGQKHSTTLQNL